MSLVKPDSVDQTFNGAVEVGVLKNHEGRLTAQFEGKFLVTLRGRTANCAADFGRTGKGYFVDICMLDQRFTGGTVSSDDVHDTGGQPDFMTDFGKGESG